jgi:hypothetical protein
LKKSNKTICGTNNITMHIDFVVASHWHMLNQVENAHKLSWLTRTEENHTNKKKGGMRKSWGGSLTSPVFRANICTRWFLKINLGAELNNGAMGGGGFGKVLNLSQNPI